MQKRIEAEKQKVIWEWKELRQFLEEQEQLLLSWLEDLDRNIVQQREKSISQLFQDVFLLDDLLLEKGEEKEQLALNRSMQVRLSVMRVLWRESALHTIRGNGEGSQTSPTEEWKGLKVVESKGKGIVMVGQTKGLPLVALLSP